ncbi:CDGSH-type Zn-finger protein [Sedimentibacter acidaminivorans]|uniref:CDGSH-type Zn-finger protein n=1 Tax=Sedimentibacter acidaminivorans TaxID=913099 RepID=A0ABS4GDC2_9FIRM|nr:CDGSH iron-sulfur domain-containing protein [Sedimentibacter acidaminivorans]MBP1925644.1 CDGSH-type Zn-finger protein [Sedimentibacter acidaminivorans]
MEKRKIALKAPIAVQLKKGETYYYCTCGKSSDQPFCDGSHKDTSFTPMEFTATLDGVSHLCACKHTKNPPYCDGTHDKL